MLRIALGILLVVAGCGSSTTRQKPRPEPSWTNQEGDITCWWVSPSPGDTWTVVCNKEVPNE